MEPSIYFFGSGNRSIPEDYTIDIFRYFIGKSKNNAQILTHRKEFFLHYGYVRKLTSNQGYIGICLRYDRMYYDVKYLFDVFDKIYTLMVEKGEIICVTSSGVMFCSKTFDEEHVAFNEYAKRILDELNISEENTLELPKIDFSISINDCPKISFEENSMEKINDVIGRYTNVYITKKESEIERIDSFQHQLHEKEDKIIELEREIDKLKTRIEYLSNPKNKQK